MRLGVSPILWANDDLPYLGARTPLDTLLAEGRGIGYEGFELGRRFPREPAALSRLLRAHDLALVSGWHSGRLALHGLEAEIQAIEPHLQLLAANGANVLVYGEVHDSIQSQYVPLVERPRMHGAEAWRQYAEALDGLARHTLSRGVRLAYHPHMGARVQSPEDIDRLMELTSPAVGLLFDSGHAYFAGADPAALLRAYLPRVCHVHLKDVRDEVLRWAENAQWSFPECILNGVFTAPGDGDLDFGVLVALLREGGYEGWLVVEAEQDPAVALPSDMARRGHDTIRALLAR